MASPGQPPKAMSSRLMGMKFMQRGAASPTNSTASSSPAAKRAKLNSGAAQATRVADQEAFQAVQAEEDAKREAILGKLAEEAGDTKWVLKAPSSARLSLNVVNAGYGTIDTARGLPLGADEEVDANQDEQPGMPQVLGRKSYGKFNKHIEKQHNPDLSSSSDGQGDEDEDTDKESNSDDEDSDEAEEEDDADDRQRRPRPSSSSVADELRARKKAKRRADAREATELANRRRDREVKLNPRMTSISSGGRSSTSGQGSTSRPPAGGSCYVCGRPDHKAAQCPRARSSSSSTTRR